MHRTEGRRGTEQGGAGRCVARCSPQASRPGEPGPLCKYSLILLRRANRRAALKLARSLALSLAHGTAARLSVLPSFLVSIKRNANALPVKPLEGEDVLAQERQIQTLTGDVRVMLL